MWKTVAMTMRGARGEKEPEMGERVVNPMRLISFAVTESSQG